MNEDSRDFDAALEILCSSHSVIALTGAGVSADSGVPTFRGDGGLWSQRPPSPANRYRQFLDNPTQFWCDEMSRSLDPWVGNLRSALDAARPNAAHHGLTRLEEIGVLRALITQNIDGLHQAAGSRVVIEIHGSRYKMRCVDCGARSPRSALFLESPPDPCGNCGGRVKFDSVLFGEPIPADVLTRARQFVDECDCILVIGTSSTVRPAGGFPRIAKANGARVIEVNVSETSLTSVCDVSIRGTAADTLPRLAHDLEESLPNWEAV